MAAVAMIGAIGLSGCGKEEATDVTGPGSEPGTLRIEVATVGTDSDLDGFVFHLVRADGLRFRAVRILPGREEALSFQVAAGTYSWTLEDVAGNCHPDTAMAATVEVSSGEIVQGSIMVECEELPSLRNRIVVATESWGPSGGELGLHTMAADGSDMQPLAVVRPPEVRRDPGVSPDGKRVVYVQNYREMRIVGEPGVVFAGENVQQPRWSPDGTVVAFSAERQILLVAPDSTGLRRLSPPPSGGVNVDWAPDGTRIVFNGWTSPESQAGLYLIDRYGSGLTPITDAHDDDPRWSPDGTRIAFSSIRNGWPARVFVMDSDGSDPAPVTNGPIGGCDGCGDWVQGWSPDGRQLLFLRVYATRETNGPDPELFIYDLERGEAVQLTDNEVAETSAFWVH